MRALNPLQYENDTLGYLDKLITVDPMRTKYYEDLRKLWLIDPLEEIIKILKMSFSKLYSWWKYFDCDSNYT